MSQQDLVEVVTDVVVVQYCTNFDAVKASTLEAIRELLLRFLQDLSEAAHKKATSLGRTNVSVLDVLELTVQRGEELESLLYQEHINADSSRAKHPAHLPGELRVKRKPKLHSKISDATGVLPSFIPSYLQVLPGKNTLVDSGRINHAVSSNSDNESSQVETNVHFFEGNECSTERRPLNAPNSVKLYRSAGVQDSNSLKVSLKNEFTCFTEEHQHFDLTNHASSAVIPYQVTPTPSESSKPGFQQRAMKESLLVQSTIHGDFSVYEVGPADG